MRWIVGTVLILLALPGHTKNNELARKCKQCQAERPRDVSNYTFFLHTRTRSGEIRSLSGVVSEDCALKKTPADSGDNGCAYLLSERKTIDAFVESDGFEARCIEKVRHNSKNTIPIMLGPRKGVIIGAKGLPLAFKDAMKISPKLANEHAITILKQALANGRPNMLRRAVKILKIPISELGVWLKKLGLTSDRWAVVENTFGPPMLSFQGTQASLTSATSKGQYICLGTQLCQKRGILPIVAVRGELEGISKIKFRASENGVGYVVSGGIPQLFQVKANKTLEIGRAKKIFIGSSGMILFQPKSKRINVKRGFEVNYAVRLFPREHPRFEKKKKKPAGGRLKDQLNVRGN